MDPKIAALKAEAQRQFGGQIPSSVGTQPNPSVSSPQATAPTSPAATPQAQPVAANNMTKAAPVMPTAQNPYGGASQAMLGSMPLTGGTFLEKSLAKRMHMYPPA